MLAADYATLFETDEGRGPAASSRPTRRGLQDVLRRGRREKGACLPGDLPVGGRARPCRRRWRAPCCWPARRAIPPGCNPPLTGWLRSWAFGPHSPGANLRLLLARFNAGAPLRPRRTDRSDQRRGSPRTHPGRAQPTPAEIVALADAWGRVTAAPVLARLTQPPADVSAMDGYALRAADGTSGAMLHVIGSAPAGHPFEGGCRPRPGRPPVHRQRRAAGRGRHPAAGGRDRRRHRGPGERGGDRRPPHPPRRPGFRPGDAWFPPAAA